MACVFHYCFTQTKREIINLVIHSLIARTDLEPHNLEVPGSSPGWSTRQKQRKLSRYKYLVAAFFLHTETPCTEFAHNLWKVVIINDKRDTPVNDILFLWVSSFCIGYPWFRYRMRLFAHKLHTF